MDMYMSMKVFFSKRTCIIHSSSVQAFSISCILLNTPNNKRHIKSSNSVTSILVMDKRKFQGRKIEMFGPPM